MIRISSADVGARATVARAEHAQGIGGEIQHSPAISNSSKHEPRQNSEPAAHGALRNPHRSKKRSAERKDAHSPGAAATQLGHADDRRPYPHEEEPVAGDRQRNRGRQDGKLHEESLRTSDLVVRLANSLRPEVPGGGRTSENEDVEAGSFSSASGENCSHELEIPS